ncbi:uncharacterized protein LOC114524948 [Dendronephthya gigantea]|uniref:uncharacterized protein LOC114524948 n=1 Tax=Dendronephthya gigantea TaxID=151771 RepID=UPI00106DCF48|nr:uncharacterized protein LOC114524948 [Dendronephthya gigantea]XP_028401998.1 uncharacterized protein LOC114524948 [Dendronephthya gigantea]
MLLRFFTFALVASIKHSFADQNCTDFDFVQSSPKNEDNHTNYIGKAWSIDCRIKGNSSTAEVRLYQDGVLRRPDGRVLKVKEQIYSLLSENNSDIGEYSCQYCNRSKIVGKITADTAKRRPTIYPNEQKPINSGESITYSCQVEGVYDMYWYRVARNGTKKLMNSVDESLWKNDFRFTRRRLTIHNFTEEDEDMYMCFIKRSTNKYVAEKEMFLAVRDSSKDMHIPVHWYYTSFRKREINGHVFLTILHVYACHLPLVANLIVLEPVKGIVWGKNFTIGQSKPIKLGQNSSFGVTVEMHSHDHGRYKDRLHIKALLHNINARVSHSSIKIMDQKFIITTAKCDKREKCYNTTLNNLVCPRYLDSLEEKLNATFILTLRDPCKEIFNLQIYNRSQSATNRSLLDAEFDQNHTHVKMNLTGYNKEIDRFAIQGKAKFSEWNLRLQVKKLSSTTKRVKLFLEMPKVRLAGHSIIMEGDYHLNCPSKGESDVKDQTKVIVFISISLIILGLVIFIGVCLYRKFSGRPRDEPLLNSMEVEPEVYKL